MVGQIPDKTNSVAKKHFAPFSQLPLAGTGVEGRKQPVLGQNACSRQAIHQGAFAGVGVTHQGDGHFARPAFHLAFLAGLNLSQLGFELAYPVIHQSAVFLQLGFARPSHADAAFKLGLVTAAPDDIDWADEVRIAVEERVAMSPDALTGMEANLRFNGTENMVTRIFGRLTAWQNWIFQRPNAVGEKGALKVYGKGDKAAFDWRRV